MEPTVPSFEFEYNPTRIQFGRGSVANLGDELAAAGRSRALVVCGSNVGANREVMEPVTAGLGDRLAGVFDETTPGKYVGTAFDGVERMREDDVDALVSVGGGSSLDVAKAMSAFAADGRPAEEIRAELESEGRLSSLDSAASPTPLFVVPTTLAGADIATGGGIKLTPEPKGAPDDPDDRRSASVSDPRLMPTALCYDPELFATTPTSVLTASAMNGFDKGVETLYSRETTPISDAHALHGLRLFRAGLPRLADADADDEALDRSVAGAVLVQYGRRTNLVHAFGHGLSYFYEVQQGAAHGVLAPHVVRYIFDRVDGRRRLLAEGLGVDAEGQSDEEVAEAVVEEIAAVRDALGLPARLRDVDGPTREELPAVARVVLDDQSPASNPPGVDPTLEEITSVLESAW